jgi:hypothetical protein
MISVVIPAFNAGRFIKRTIDSVLSQTYKDYEIIVVDDGSADNTGELVKSYGEKVRYIYQPNAGDGPARSTGVKAAKGEWIAFLDHDDEWLPEKLQLQVELLNKHPDLRWCAGNFYNQSGSKKAPAVEPAVISGALGGSDYSENYFTAVLRTGCNFMTSTMVIHKEVFEQAGVFDSCWMRCADLDMWWRITYRFPKIGCLPQPLAILHIEVQDVTSTMLRLTTKRGEETRRLVAQHLKLARERGMLEEFVPLAFSVLKKALLTTIFQGFGTDSREIVTQFKELFGWHWRVAVYLATISPKATSSAAKAVAYVWHKLGLERDISRRWINSGLSDGSETITKSGDS